MIAQMMLPEFDQEMRVTRTLLERVPEKDAQWKPHPKSYSLGQLAAHIANLPGLLTIALSTTEYDIAKRSGSARPPDFTTTEEVLQRFDANIAVARTALSDASDEDLGVLWTFKAGDRTILAVPRAAAARSFVMSHMIHHRGQLSVYLRERDVPLPSIYGPSADTPI